MLNRYIVDSEHLLARVLWILAIAGSFTFAGFMVASNLKETAENPISTSVDTIPVQVGYQRYDRAEIKILIPTF